jgi:hypothetical protein
MSWKPCEVYYNIYLSLFVIALTWARSLDLIIQQFSRDNTRLHCNKPAKADCAHFPPPPPSWRCPWRRVAPWLNRMDDEVSGGCHHVSLYRTHSHMSCAGLPSLACIEQGNRILLVDRFLLSPTYHGHSPPSATHPRVTCLPSLHQFVRSLRIFDGCAEPSVGDEH